MQPRSDNQWTAERWHLSPAVAYVRGHLGLRADEPDAAVLDAAVRAGLRLYRFKRKPLLPRVSKVLGALKGIQPAELLDIGSGRGAFLWPLLDQFPSMPVTVIDQDEIRATQLECVRSGGISRLDAYQMDATCMDFDSKSFDVVTALEVLEHIPSCREAVAECVRVARRFVLVSVPSKPDDNPQHINLFTSASLAEILQQTGATRVAISYVPNHMIAVATL